MIGVFDSGVGGLTVLKHLIELAPQSDYIYLADTARVPYGDRPRAELEKIAESDVEFLIANGADYIAAGCGTASSVLLPKYTRGLPVPFCSALEPAAKRVARSGKSIAFLATAASVESGSFARLVLECNPNASIKGVSCPDFVPLIEDGLEKNRAAIERAAKKYAEQANGSDIVVLGCTHFPLVRDILAEYTDAEIVDMGREVACEAAGHASAESGRLRLYVSGERESFVRSAGKILMRDVSEITEKFDWKQYEKQIHDNDRRNK